MPENDYYEPLVTGIGLSGYRSFASWQQVRFPTKVTVIAGINNSGKSNILRFLQAVAPSIQGSPNRGQGLSRPKLADIDLPRGFDGSATFEIGMPIRIDRSAASDPRKSRIYSGSLTDYQMAAMTLLQEEDEDFYWTRFALVDGNLSVHPQRIEQAMREWPDWDSTYRPALNALNGGTVDSTDVMRRILNSIPLRPMPPVVTISSSRRVEATDDLEPDWLSGRGIIRALAEIQNPPHDKWSEAQPRWAAINKFVRTVIGDKEASLNIPFDFSTIQVETPQRVLPLSSLGSGIEQVIVLAAAATVTTKSLVCVEEPETNLHPLLQKKLVRYLTDETDNQYVIATHSSHLLDDARATAYHVRLTDRGSAVSLARRDHELVQVCSDLGYRPSDLLQANCVIWVEGPSDRTYIRRWIELVDSGLSEGIDYSMMFYGGRLLSHLSVSESALDDFISLRHLNRHSAVVIDSDKLSSRAHIGQTKKRIKSEFERDFPAPGHAWVTNCYTIENYIDEGLMKKAVESVHKRETYGPVGQWDNPLAARSTGGSFDKIAIADVIAGLLDETSLDRFGLRKEIMKLCAFIRTASGNSVDRDPSVR
ncbi:ATP-dependent endonuclease [Isoptericola sp. NPDC056605]|uniref:ATP-dependent nuclease n=1 Tax=Isoptericola sp. NPDC056605 TaxID=3345876 RepID=UPI003687E204